MSGIDTRKKNESNCKCLNVNTPPDKKQVKMQFKLDVRRRDEKLRRVVVFTTLARYSLKQKPCLLISSHLNESNKMDFEIMHSFDTVARGYHYYRKCWQPKINQTLYLSHSKKQ